MITIAAGLRNRAPTSLLFSSTFKDHFSTQPSIVHGEAHPPLLNETIGSNFCRTIENYANNPSIVSVHQRKRITYEQFYQEVTTAACAFLHLGVQPQDRVAVWSTNCYEWTVCQYALAVTGAISVSLNPSYKEEELKYTLHQSKSSLLIVGQEFKSQSMIEIAQNTCQTPMPHLRHCIVLNSNDHRNAPPPTMKSSSSLSWIPWDDFRSAGLSQSLRNQLYTRESLLQPNDPVNIQYTSGTTGKPKAAMLSHHNILNNGFFIGEKLEYKPEQYDRVCIPVPLFHCFGQVLGNIATTTHGATMVYPSATFHAEETLRAVHDEKCTSLYGVPSMFIAELQHHNFKQYDTSSLRTGIMAGSICPIEIMRRVQSEMNMKDVSICFGMTETSPVSFQTEKDDPLDKKVATVGKVHPHIEACIVATTNHQNNKSTADLNATLQHHVASPPTPGTILPRNMSGELLVRGYSVMLGYYDNPRATSLAIDRDGWMHTGDLAVLDDHGYCTIVGRMKDVVIRGGENLFPKEIEDFLFEHPAIAEVQVFGVPDKRMGEELCAWIKLKKVMLNEQHMEESIRRWCMHRISRHKIPKYMRFVDKFPQTTSGKHQKYVMKARMIEELGLTSYME